MADSEQDKGQCHKPQPVQQHLHTKALIRKHIHGPKQRHKETERQRNRKTERHRDTERQTEIDRDRDRDRDRQTERDRERERERERDRDRQKETDRERQRDRDRETGRREVHMPGSMPLTNASNWTSPNGSDSCRQMPMTNGETTSKQPHAKLAKLE